MGFQVASAEVSVQNMSGSSAINPGSIEAAGVLMDNEQVIETAQAMKQNMSGTQVSFADQLSAPTVGSPGASQDKGWEV